MSITSVLLRPLVSSRGLRRGSEYLKTDFVLCAEINTYDDRLIEIKSLVHALPKANYDVLEFVMRHLCRVADESDVNKMEPPNLAIVFG